MQAQQQSFIPAHANTSAGSADVASQTKKAVQGAEGYEAQAARLVPPEDTQGTIPSPNGKAATAGPALVAVQNKLNSLGFACGAADGIMGPKTRGALVAFQNAKGLSPTGTADDATVSALNGQNTPNTTTPVPPSGTAGTSGGAAGQVIGNGPQLKAAQEKLNNLGYSAGVADGIMGPRTKGALQAFQNAKGLSATGTLDSHTLDKLDEVAAKTPAPTTTTGTSGGKAGGTGEKADDKLGATPPTPGTPASGARQAVAAAAYAEVGKVRAKETTAKDDEGKPARVGWDRLAEYFNVSLGGAWKDQELIKRPRKGSKLKHGTTTGETVETSDTLPSWCGIFAIWAVKSAGFSIGTWGIGKSAPNIMKGRNKVPKVGDVVVMSNNNHHAVVVWVAPDAEEKAAAGKLNSIEIKTVDGNSGSNPVSGGEVVDKGSSTMAKWDYGAWSPE